MKNLLWIILVMAWLRAAGEGFEKLPLGGFEKVEIELGTLVAKKGHGVIHGSHAKEGRQSLRLLGGRKREVELLFEEPLEEKKILSFWSERWTSREPFSFEIEARAGDGWGEIYRGDKVVRVGGFLTLVEVPLAEGTVAVRFRSTTPGASGIMIDDLQLEELKPMGVIKVTTIQPVVPVLIRKEINPVVGLHVMTEGRTEAKEVAKLRIDLKGTTEIDAVKSVKVLFSAGQAKAGAGKVFGVAKKDGDGWLCEGNARLVPGHNYFWVSVEMDESADLDGRVDAQVLSVEWRDGTSQKPEVISPEGSQRIGYAIRLHGDDGAKAYRIPGMVETNEGSLIAVYDVRWRGGGDLPGDIDVGMSRSTDGGQSWEKMKIIMDMGDDPKWRYDGVGDPAVLVDRRTGRTWVVATWSHGNRSWNGSGPGMTPEETGQLMMSYSDDDGVSWSEPRNLTRQLKKPEWHFLLEGPGAGITTKDGTLVFAAQFQAGPKRTPYSSIMFSRDRGETWEMGTGIKSNTTEAQVVELKDGSLMLNCRDNRGGARTVGVTRDLGKTWELHPTDRKGLREPVCMAGLIRIGERLYFSNPDTTRGRYNTTIKVSEDDGMTWPEKWHTLYEARLGNGYSTLAPVGEDRIGVLYEGVTELYFIRFPLDELSR
jgi:sialidase-1